MNFLLNRGVNGALPKMKPKEIFRTKHFVIREATMGDVHGWMSFWNDPEVMKFIGDGTWGGGEDVVREVLRKNILYYQTHPGLGDWAVEAKDSGQIVGEVSMEILPGTEEIEVGYILCKAFWGRGFATELLQGLLNYGFSHLNLNQICAVTNPENLASTRVMEKCGMIFIDRVFDRNVWVSKYIIYRGIGTTVAAMQWSEFSFILKPSSLGGIGVFATHDIPSGTPILNKRFELRTMKVKDVPADFIKYVIYVNDEECLCPERFDRMEIGWYINHSPTPNIAKKGAVRNFDAIKSSKERNVYAIKDIKAGDEILIDYNYLGEPEHLKETYYRQAGPMGTVKS